MCNSTYVASALAFVYDDMLLPCYPLPVSVLINAAPAAVFDTLLYYLFTHLHLVPPIALINHPFDLDNTLILTLFHRGKCAFDHLFLTLFFFHHHFF